MVRKQTSRRDNFSTVKGQTQKSRTKWLIVLFILMITVTIIGSYILYQYTSIKDSYQSYVYGDISGLESENTTEEASTEAYTHLLITLDNVYVEGNQVEEALWSKMYYMNPEQSTIQSIDIPMNIVAESHSNDESLTLNTYGEAGVQGVKEQMEDFLQVQIDYLTVVRLQNIRDILDPLETIPVTAPDNLSGGDFELVSGRTYGLTGHQSSQLLAEARNLPIFEQMHVHQAIYEGLISELTSLDNLLQLPNILSHGEFVVASEIPFGKLVDIYRKDDYNLTDVDLNQLIELESTQVDNQQLYIADLDELRTLTARMSSAIEEAAY